MIDLASSGRTALGEVPFRPEISGHTSMLSIGGRPELAASWSVGSWPASPANVAYPAAQGVVRDVEVCETLPESEREREREKIGGVDDMRAECAE
jgi:hypothetical protein